MTSGNQQGKGGGRGFAGMDESKQREIASEGGRAAHESGHAHEFSSEEAREAGRKGGEAVSKDREHTPRLVVRATRTHKAHHDVKAPLLVFQSSGACPAKRPGTDGQAAVIHRPICPSPLGDKKLSHEIARVDPSGERHFESEDSETSNAMTSEPSTPIKANQ